MMRGYDEDGNLLLPPRLAGEELPPELLQYYREQEEKMKEAKAKAKAKAEAEKLKLEGIKWHLSLTSYLINPL